MLIARHALVRDGLRLLLAGLPWLVVVAAATSPDEGLALLAWLAADVVVVDIDGEGDVALVRCVRALVPGAGIVALGLASGRATGADYFVDKRDAPRRLAVAIRAMAGRSATPETGTAAGGG